MRAFCTCGFSGCNGWCYADQLTSDSLRCLCGRPFQEEFVPKHLLIQLAALHKLDDKNGKWKDVGNEQDQDADMGVAGSGTTATPDELALLKKQLHEEQEMARRLVNDFKTEVPQVLAERIAALQSQINKATS